MTKMKSYKSTIKRERRLSKARKWITTYEGKNVIRGYKKRFGVDVTCAIKELQIIGAKLDDTHVEQLLINEKRRIETLHKKKLLKIEKEERLNRELFSFDDEFAYIAGYTSGGAPYGIRWDELSEEELESYDSSIYGERNTIDDDFDLPF